MTTYVITKKTFSEKALRKLGHGFVWKPVTKTKVRPPTDERGFHDWLWMLVSDFGNGTYHIVRNQEKGESAGFKPICLCSIDENSIFIERGYNQIKSHPYFGARRQAYFKNVRDHSRFGHQLVKVK